MKVSESIRALLRNHKCVIIPNFGAFLVKSSPAFYERILKAIRPPATTIFFNSELKKNDDLLINSIRLTEEISYIAAEKKVDEFVNEVSQTLIDRRSYILKGIGKIYMENDEIKFKSSQSEELNSDGFGLPTLFVSEINRKRQDKELVEKVIETQTKKVSPWATMFTVAASLAAILMAGSLYFLNNGTDAEKQLIQKSFVGSIFDIRSSNNANQTAKVELFEENSKTESSKDTPTETASPLPTKEEITEATVVSTTKDKLVQPEIEQALETPVNQNPVTDSSHLRTDFHVVVGMFNQSKNAEIARLDAEAKGYKPRTIKGKKYYRVIIPFSSKQITWVAAQKEVRENVSNDAWVWETRYKTNR